METILLHPETEGQRIDAYLAQALEGITRAYAQRLLEQGLVLRCGKPLKKSDKTIPGVPVSVSLPEPEPLDVLPQDIPLSILYEDADVVVINKPRGMVVHPAPGHPDGTLVNALLYHCRDSLSGIGGTLRPGIVHRIDKETSGLLLVAKNDAAHLSLSAQLQDHSLSRVYLAVVRGNLREDTGTINAPIGRHPTHRKKMAVTETNSKPAVTHYEVLARFPGYTFIRCRLETGRTHQIRVHMAHIGHPLLGDTVYGEKRPVTGLSGQCLHAQTIRFSHPGTGAQMEFSCPLPADFQKILVKLKQNIKIK
ncbi:MAG: RluA family pseudouridine synthase [Oscillospiraceae bacterium]|nr:RluA family pseudouridine synthase [Oscillospiraceae bacterium]